MRVPSRNKCEAAAGYYDRGDEGGIAMREGSSREPLKREWDGKVMLQEVSLAVRHKLSKL